MEAKKDIGIQLWSVRDAMKSDVETTIKKLGDMGYTFIESAGYADGKFYDMAPETFTKLVEDNGMRYLSSHTGQAVPDSAKWEETMKWWDECIAAHKAAGVKYIVQPWMGEKGYASLEGLQAYCDYFNAVGEKCKNAGIKFGYHNHAKEFTKLEGEMIYDYMLENTDSEKVFFQLDLYWINEGGESAVEYFNKYPGRFLLWHIKDEEELGASGKMDFAPAFNQAEKAGMKHIIVEVERYNYEPLVSVEKSLEYLQNAEFVK
jgi:sugar phosphate isomerase/epimerase